jgi:hypothetical protein
MFYSNKCCACVMDRMYLREELLITVIYTSYSHLRKQIIAFVIYVVVTHVMCVYMVSN